MALNKEIEEFIQNSDEFDNDMKSFLIEALTLELERYKSGYKQYSKDYDRILNKYIVK